MSQEFKKGDRVRIRASHKYGANVGEVTGCTFANPIVAIDGVLSNRRGIDENFLEKVPPSIENLLVGDVIENKDRKRKVLGIQGDLVFISYLKKWHKYSTTATKAQLTGWDYTVVSDDEPQEETIEMTLEEVADKVGVDVEKLRIKDRD